MDELQKCQYISITDIQKEYLPISRKKASYICQEISGHKDDRKSYFVNRNELEEILNNPENQKLPIQ